MNVPQQVAILKEAQLAKDDKKTPDPQEDRAEQVFMQEVDAAVREDDLKNFAYRYGIWIGLGLVIALVALAGWIFYNNSKQEESGVRCRRTVNTCVIWKCSVEPAKRAERHTAPSSWMWPSGM